MYCGDETGSFIGEIASSSCRFGYGGEDCPKSVISSYMCQNGNIPISTHHHPSGDDQDIVQIFKPHANTGKGSTSSSINPNDYLDNGIIENYDAWENAWQTAMRQLHVGTLNKHTRGGTRISTPCLHSSGLKSSFIQKGEMETEPEPEPGVIMHPLLCLGINLC